MKVAMNEWSSQCGYEAHLKDAIPKIAAEIWEVMIRVWFLLPQSESRVVIAAAFHRDRNLKPVNSKLKGV